MSVVVWYTILSVIGVSLVAVLGILPLIWKKKMSEQALLVLVSISAGTLFGGAFFHLIPESIQHGNYTLGTALAMVAGIFVFFILEKFIHYHHHHHSTHPDATHKSVHGHGYHLAAVNLIGDGIHNFLDGLLIATSYAVSLPVGIATTVAVLLHEVPQEIADFGVLLYSGLSKMKALLFNGLSAGLALIGAIVGLVASSSFTGFTTFMIPFAAGSFLYIAGSNLVPELHKHCSLKESALHIIAMAAGIGIMVALLFIAPGHIH